MKNKPEVPLNSLKSLNPNEQLTSLHYIWVNKVRFTLVRQEISRFNLNLPKLRGRICI